MTSSMRKNNFEDIQEEHRKILEKIESALHKLNSVIFRSIQSYPHSKKYIIYSCKKFKINSQERTHIFEQYNSNVQKLTEKLFYLEESKSDQLTVMSCREDLLNAKKEMFLWNKTTKKTQIDIVVRQISTLQLQLDAKKIDFHDTANNELQVLQNMATSDDVS